jgi:Phage tail assembly chaperone protein
MTQERPVHRLKSTGAIVFPSGHDPDNLEPIPVGYWEAFDTAEKVAAMRHTRNAILDLTDKTQLSDRSAAAKLLWQPYRDALRDLPVTFDPANPVWPTPPAPLSTLE